MAAALSSSSFGPPTPNPTVDPQLVGRYLTSVAGMLTRAAQINPAQSPELPSRIGTALFAARLLESKAVQYQPGLVEGWREVAQQLSVMTEQRSRDGINRNVQDLSQSSKPSAPTDAEDRIKSLLDRAERTTDFGQRDELYRQAAFALQRNDPARAFSLADKISDLDLRKKNAFLDWLPGLDRCHRTETMGRSAPLCAGSNRNGSTRLSLLPYCGGRAQKR